MRKIHLVKVHFDRRKPEIDQVWLDWRYRFFAEHTLKSLQAQTLKDWRLWIACGPGMEGRIANLLPLAPANTIVTFEGALNGCHHPQSHYFPGVLPDDYFYVTRLDSDDLYAPTALALSAAVDPSESGRVEANLFRRGYLHDMLNKRTGVYHNPSPPFHTLMVPAAVFLDPIKYQALNYGDHSRVNTDFPCLVMPDWQFAVLVHGKNFISDFNYSREKDSLVEKGWSERMFLQQPVVFDVDDFCDEHNCLADLDELKLVYPRFRCTLFTIPARSSKELLKEARKRDWVELAVHGIRHEPNEEMKAVNFRQLKDAFYKLDWGLYARGFRPPGWYMSEDALKACNVTGMWVALHERDKSKWGPRCEYGRYVCSERLPSWHGHAHEESGCNNGIHGCMSVLKAIWPFEQVFATVSEAVLVRQKE